MTSRTKNALLADALSRGEKNGKKYGTKLNTVAMPAAGTKPQIRHSTADKT